MHKASSMNTLVDECGAEDLQRPAWGSNEKNKHGAVIPIGWDQEAMGQVMTYCLAF